MDSTDRLLNTLHQELRDFRREVRAEMGGLRAEIRADADPDRSRFKARNRLIGQLGFVIVVLVAAVLAIMVAAIASAA